MPAGLKTSGSKPPTSEALVEGVEALGYVNSQKNDHHNVTDDNINVYHKSLSQMLGLGTSFLMTILSVGNLAL